MKFDTGNRVIDNTLEKYHADFINDRLSSEQKAGYTALLTGPPPKNTISDAVISSIPALVFLADLGIKWLSDRKNRSKPEPTLDDIVKDLKRRQDEINKMFRQSQI
ncbi:MAG: hypothetical protein OXI24_21695 [Candidatus Poribacteria bacterium]|nr:hypothetical protein [Candidatus Poribacteria bacterium]